MSIRADYWDDLADEQRDGTGPEHFRLHNYADADFVRDLAENERLELAAERAATLRAVSAERRDQLVAAAHRQVRFAQPTPVGAWIGSLVGAALVGGSLGFATAFVLGVIA